MFICKSRFDVTLDDQLPCILSDPCLRRVRCLEVLIKRCSSVVAENQRVDCFLYFFVRRVGPEIRKRLLLNGFPLNRNTEIAEELDVQDFARIGANETAYVGLRDIGATDIGNDA